MNQKMKMMMMTLLICSIFFNLVLKLPNKLISQDSAINSCPFSNSLTWLLMQWEGMGLEFCAGFNNNKSFILYYVLSVCGNIFLCY